MNADPGIIRVTDTSVRDIALKQACHAGFYPVGDIADGNQTLSGEQNIDFIVGVVMRIGHGPPFFCIFIGYFKIFV